MEYRVVLRLAFVRPTALSVFFFSFVFFVYLFLCNLNRIIYWYRRYFFYLLEAKKAACTHIVIVNDVDVGIDALFRIAYLTSVAENTLSFFHLSSRGRFDVLIHLHWSYREEQRSLLKEIVVRRYLIYRSGGVSANSAVHAYCYAFFFFIEYRCASSIVSFFIVCCVTCCVPQLACVVIWIVFSRRISS